MRRFRLRGHHRGEARGAPISQRDGNVLFERLRGGAGDGVRVIADAATYGFKIRLE